MSGNGNDEEDKIIRQKQRKEGKRKNGRAEKNERWWTKTVIVEVLNLVWTRDIQPSGRLRGDVGYVGYMVREIEVR